MKRNMIIFIVVAIILVIGVFRMISIKDQVIQSVGYQKITAQAAKEKMTDEAIILDVRTREEFEQGHIEGAILLPVDAILAEEIGVLTDKTKTLLVYCRSGNRSRTASKKLVELGFTTVYDFGGIIDWPYDIVK